MREKRVLQKDDGKDVDRIMKCPVCDVYLHRDESFTCPRCKKGSLCRKHRVAGRRECASCVFDLKHAELHELRSQEVSIRHFMRFLQFIFLVFAVFFITYKLGLAEFVEVIQDTMVGTYLAYFGLIPVACYILFMLILYNQRNKIEDVELQIRKLEVRR